MLNICPNCGGVKGFHGSILSGCMCQFQNQTTYIVSKEMRKALKRIWLDDYLDVWQQNNQGEGAHIEYIRADLVDELYEALEELIKYVGRDHAGVGLADLHNKGIYALAKIKEEE